MDREISEREILKRLAANDPLALEMMWNLYSSDLLGYLTSILCSRHEAEDTLQDVFVTVAKKRAAVAKARLLKPYLFRLARNTALNRVQRQKGMRERVREIQQWLALRLDLGIEFAFHRERFSINRQEVADLGQVRPFLQVALVFWKH